MLIAWVSSFLLAVHAKCLESAPCRYVSACTAPEAYLFSTCGFSSFIFMNRNSDCIWPGSHSRCHSFLGTHSLARSPRGSSSESSPLGSELSWLVLLHLLVSVILLRHHLLRHKLRSHNCLGRHHLRGLLHLLSGRHLLGHLLAFCPLITRGLHHVYFPVSSPFS